MDIHMTIYICLCMCVYTHTHIYIYMHIYTMNIIRRKENSFAFFFSLVIFISTRCTQFCRTVYLNTLHVHTHKHSHAHTHRDTHELTKKKKRKIQQML